MIDAWHPTKDTTTGGPCWTEPYGFYSWPPSYWQHLQLAGGAGAFKIYPHAILINTYKTAKTQIEWFTGKESVIGNIRFVDIAPDRVEAYRFEFVAARTLTDPILVTGGLEQFAEYYPGHVGCLAIEYDGGGNVVQAYPYRPEEIEKTPPLVGFLLRAAARVLDAQQGASPVCVALRQW